MRTVFRNSDEVYHVWAQQTQESGRNRTGSSAFHWRHAYSYHATIAGIWLGPAESVVLLSGDHYSKETSGHLASVRRATQHLPQFASPAGYRISDITTPESIRENWAAVIEERGRLYLAATRKPSRAKLLRELTALTTEANRLCTYFGFELFPVPDADATITAYVAEADRRRVELDARRATERKAALRADSRREARLRRTARADLERWKAGELVNYGQFYLLRNTMGDALRMLPGDPATVETTQRAYVPVEHIRHHAPLLLRIIRAGKDWEPNGRTIHLGHYAVTRITAAGTLHIGCHRFLRAELERFAVLLALPVEVT